MAPKMCVDCTEFNDAQGMHGHPIFTTEYDWALHRHKSHGGPKPDAPEAKQPAPEAAPAPAPEAAPQHDGPPNELKELIAAVDARFENLEEVQNIQGEEIKSWAARVVELENKLQNPTA